MFLPIKDKSEILKKFQKQYEALVITHAHNSSIQKVKSLYFTG
jgi:mRNA degradation ribonuclease J1/J2